MLVVYSFQEFILNPLFNLDVMTSHKVRFTICCCFCFYLNMVSRNWHLP